ncbi:GNAT family N-acetyltransferase [Aestuariicoccus sp. MJ-SS9]|uniref:GNAT family N-acetyltransferase n=1 Tax=Aestuariicoccus sp. MJ-SS9 TaxID=3079855 RepID=UPI002913A898|nr:GNAT family N-acetyltransferase [Aestuariicoccus sp. MJ-SS9]MDU8912034.1 GNAT family N-acetyltransferase [Aestuariicoccus sp. MJ-SS9]
MTGLVTKVRSPAQIAAVTALVWEFFDFLRGRYPEMQREIDDYIAKQNVAADLANFADVFLPPKGECLAVEREGEIVGMVMLRQRADGDAEMNRMYVRESARGLGLGRMLCSALIEEARSLGYGAVWLGALYRHVEALPLYESMGFKRARDPAAHNADDDRVIQMKLVF